MKKYKTAIIALVLILGALLGYFAVKTIQSDAPASPTQEPSKAFSAFPFSGESAKKQIVQLELFTEEYILLRKTANVWSCPSWPDDELSQVEVQRMVSRICSYVGPLVYEGEVTEDIREEFGFTDDSKFIVTMENGKTYTAFIGSTSTSGGAHYIWVEGVNRIVLYEKEFRAGILVSKVDLISTVVFNFSDFGQITKIHISKNGEDFVYLTATLSGVEGEARQWEMQFPIQRSGHNSNIQSLLNKLASVQKEEIEASKCTDLAAYGLSPAVYSVSLTAPDKTITLHIGNKTTDGNGYYFNIDDGTDVFVVSASSIAFKDATPMQYLDEVVFSTDYTNLSTVQISLNGKTHTMKYEFKDDEERLYFNGKRVPEEHARTFSKVLSAVYCLEITNLDVEHAPEKPTGEVLCTVRYEESDGTVTTVTCTVRDASTMFFYVNDVYTGGYGPRYTLTSDAENLGVQASIDVLLNILK